MDKEQARFILQSFRPDGADAQDPDFADALAVAAQDRELGEWLAGERSEDASFAAALAAVRIPEDLRDNILQVLRGEEGGEDYSGMDSAFAGALASVRPPDGLRDQIVAAMRVEESKGDPVAKAAPRRVRNWLGSAAVAAALALGVFVAIEVTGGDQPTLSKKGIENHVITLVDGGVELDLTGPRASEFITYLDAKHVPAPNLADLPGGLAHLKAIGCKVLKMGEKSASLICFDKDGVPMHLIVVRREDLIEKDLPVLADVKSGNCFHCPKTGVTVAAWRDGKRAFFLASDTTTDDLLKVF